MGRWQRSKQLASASWQVLKMDKELMVLPLISGIAALLIGASFLVPIFLTARSTDPVTGGTTAQFGPVQYLLFGAMYLALAYVTIFFRTALLCAADERLQGGNPNLGSALSAAGKRAGKILPWAVVSATVSVILRSLENRAGLLGRIVISIVGMAWAVVTFLVLPIIAFEGVGVGAAVKRSTELLKHTWGENLIVNGGIGLISLLLMLPAFLVGGLGIATGTAPGAIVGITVGVLWLIVVMCWSNAMSGIFQAALYRYAVNGSAPGPFATVDLGGAFRQRGNRRGGILGGGGGGGNSYGGQPQWGQPAQPQQPWAQPAQPQQPWGQPAQPQQPWAQPPAQAPGAWPPPVQPSPGTPPPSAWPPGVQPPSTGFPPPPPPPPPAPPA
ncbi:MAG TPA: DUF6159 family protein [Acidimicrobiales bacterium]|jgi:hypothetical protein